MSLNLALIYLEICFKLFKLEDIVFTDIATLEETFQLSFIISLIRSCSVHELNDVTSPITLDMHFVELVFSVDNNMRVIILSFFQTFKLFCCGYDVSFFMSLFVSLFVLFFLLFFYVCTLAMTVALVRFIILFMLVVLWNSRIVNNCSQFFFTPALLIDFSHFPNYLLIYNNIILILLFLNLWYFNVYISALRLLIPIISVNVLYQWLFFSLISLFLILI